MYEDLGMNDTVNNNYHMGLNFRVPNMHMYMSSS